MALIKEARTAGRGFFHFGVKPEWAIHKQLWKERERIEKNIGCPVNWRQVITSLLHELHDLRQQNGRKS